MSITEKDLAERDAILNGASRQAGPVLAVRPVPADWQVWLGSEPLAVTRSVGLPRFPVDVLPEPFAAMVAAVAEFTQTDPGMAGTSLLAMLAACAGGRVEVQARPGWREPSCLYTATVAVSGERKSAVQAVLSAPLQDAERELAAAGASAILEAETTRDIARKAAERAKHKAGQSDSAADRDQLLAEAIAAEMYSMAIVVPAAPRLLADDVTPEAVGSLLAGQGGRLAIVSAEAGIFAIIGGRYSGNVPNLDVWLKGHAGDRIRVDRKGRDPEFIDRPALTVSVMVQPRILQKVGQNDDMRGSGLLARFLYCVPVTRVGGRNVRPEPVPAAVAVAYTESLRRLAVDLAAWIEPVVVVLQPDSVEVLMTFAAAVERRLGPGSDLAHIADWGNKITGAAVRIAGLLHLAEHGEPGVRADIAASTMTAAVRLAEYFIAHAVAAFDGMGTDPVTELARQVLDVVRAKTLHHFSVRELRRSYVQHRESGDVTAALALLTEHGWLRRRPAPEKDGPGRAGSPEFAVHPAAFQHDSLTRNTQNTQNGATASIPRIPRIPRTDNHPKPIQPEEETKRAT